MLGEINDPRVMELLSQLINDDDPNVVTNARFAIRKISQRDKTQK